MPSPLSLSPLNIEYHEFVEINLRASREDDPQGSLSLQTKRALQPIDKNDFAWEVTLQVTFGHSKENDEKAPYVGHIEVTGVFSISPQYTHDKRTLIEVTATSILYGACREMLANLTARSKHGILSLPSISFAPIVKKAKKATKKKVAKKKSTKKAGKKK